MLRKSIQELCIFQRKKKSKKLLFSLLEYKIVSIKNEISTPAKQEFCCFSISLVTKGNFLHHALCYYQMKILFNFYSRIAFQTNLNITSIFFIVLLNIQHLRLIKRHKNICIVEYNSSYQSGVSAKILTAHIFMYFLLYQC